MTRNPPRALHDGLIVAALLLLAILPFSEAVLDPSKFPAGLDSIQHYSRESFVRRAFASGALPTWNPYEFSGFPALADPQTGVFYPPSIALRVLPVPTFLTWTIIFHIWIVGVGMYVLCRVVGVGRWVACIASVGMMLGGVTMPRVYAGHLDVLRTVAWTPLALALAIRSIDRPTIWPSVLLVVVLSLQVLGSFLQLAVYTFAAILAYAIFSACWPRFGPRSWRLATRLGAQVSLLLLLTCGLAAVQLVPTAALMTVAGRVQGVAFHDAVQRAIGMRELAQFVVPPVGPTPEGWETSSYIGLLIAVIAPAAFVAVRSRRFVSFFGIAACATLALASGGALYRWHHAIAPMFRLPGRFIVFWSIAVCVLGAIALDWLTEPPTRTNTAAPPSSKWRMLALGLASVIVPLDLGVYARPFVEIREARDRWMQSLPFVPTPGGRVLSLCDDLRSNELSAMAVPTVDGYNSYFLRDYARFAQLSQRDTDEEFTMYPRMGGASPGLLRWEIVSMLNVTEVISCYPLSERGLTLLGRFEPFYVYRNTLASGRVASSCGSRESEEFVQPCTPPDDVHVKLLSADQPDGKLRFTITSTTPQQLLLSEPYYWERRALIDGVETDVRKVNVALSAIGVEGGNHVVELRYVPTSVYAGAIITSLTALLLVFVGKARLSRRAGLSCPP